MQSDETRAYRAYIELCSRVLVVVVVVVVSGEEAQPAMKIAASPRNVSAIRFFFMMQKKRIQIAKWMGCGSSELH